MPPPRPPARRRPNLGVLNLGGLGGPNLGVARLVQGLQGEQLVDALVELAIQPRPARFRPGRIVGGGGAGVQAGSGAATGHGNSFEMRREVSASRFRCEDGGGMRSVRAGPGDLGKYRFDSDRTLRATVYSTASGPWALLTPDRLGRRRRARPRGLIPDRERFRSPAALANPVIPRRFCFPRPTAARGMEVAPIPTRRTDAVDERVSARSPPKAAKVAGHAPSPSPQGEDSIRRRMERGISAVPGQPFQRLKRGWRGGQAFC